MIHNDHLSTPQKMTDASGVVVWSADYKPFGEATVNPSSTITNNLRFPGQYFDAEMGMNYNLNRDYNAVLGRYIEADPSGIQQGENHLFGYVDNNPVNYVDLTGHSKGGPKNIGTEGFTKKSDIKAVEEALKEAQKLKQCKRIKALRALLKVIKRGGSYVFIGPMLDPMLDKMIDDMFGEPQQCPYPSPYDPSCYGT